MEKTNEIFQILNYFSTFASIMTGLYIHIPFCKSRCIYCGFYSTTDIELRQRYVDALIKEGQKRKTADVISTIYLGGGTPSQLSISQLQQLFDALYNIYKVEPSVEITIECNPDDVSDSFATALSQLPINRISMGAQTFNDQRLQFLHRRHTAAQVSLAVERLRKAGINNISIDLMYGFPNESLEDWQHDIDKALALDVEHISAYCLMIEEGTVLYEKMNKGIKECDEELERQMYYTLKDRLTGAGYEHYEISNFARPGYQSRHNSSYWTDIPSIGLGAAAHSYDGASRLWNVSNIQQYIQGIETGQPTIEREELDAASRYNDRVMLSLSTCNGLNLDSLNEQDTNYLLSQAKKFLDEGLLRLESNHLRLSKEGLFVSNMIMSDLMKV